VANSKKHKTLQQQKMAEIRIDNEEDYKIDIIEDKEVG
jgi:hypothetical protein